LLESCFSTTKTDHALLLDDKGGGHLVDPIREQIRKGVGSNSGSRLSVEAASTSAEAALAALPSGSKVDRRA
jgi:hypothetical protein